MKNNKKSSARNFYSRKDRTLLMKVMESYAKETVDILGHSIITETIAYISPVVDCLKRQWNTNHPSIIAAAMYEYGYMEGKNDERKRRNGHGYIKPRHRATK